MAKTVYDRYMEKFETLMPTFARGFHSDDPACVAGLDVTVSQFCVLKVLYRNDGCKMKELSAALGVTLGNMTSMIDRMTRDGYVGRVSDPSDRRVVRVKLTKRGKGILHKAFEKKRKNISRALRLIPISDIDSLFKIMEKIANVIKFDLGGKR
jgi:DNA-binding MarR family transcriptional regulator